MTDRLELEFYLPVPPQKVMRLLTEPELIKAWSGNNAVFENRTAGRYQMFDGWVSGEILKTGEYELSYTWDVIEWENTSSQVEYILHEENGTTRIEVKHTGFPGPEEMARHEAGWTEYFFGPMENYILENDL